MKSAPKHKLLKTKNEMNEGNRKKEEKQRTRRGEQTEIRNEKKTSKYKVVQTK